jgi:ubiquinone/menaquinone biosynthesis C-methylase UbiE
MDDGDYVLGTHDEEIARLGVQHAVWRPRALDAWRRAGLTVGQRVIDFGCGPGYASLDLADVVGPRGEVVALDRSERFLQHLRRAADVRGLGQIRIHEADLAAEPTLPDACDGAWCRWILAFLPRPRDALRRLVRAVRPGGAIVIHEYAQYGAWRLIPAARSFDRFVAEVMTSWRAEGGEPDIGPDLIAWLEDAGCRIEAVQTICDVAGPSDFVWHWPAGFFEGGLTRLVELGRVDAAEADAMRRDFAAAAANPRTRMVTPMVVEIIARRSGGG